MPKVFTRKARPDYYEDDGSDLDGFIDDDPIDDEAEVALEMHNIFGGYRKRYANVDDRDIRMESSLAQQEKEERRSRALGKKDDMAAFQAEERRRLEKLKRKKEKKKKKKKH